MAQCEVVYVNFTQALHSSAHYACMLLLFISFWPVLVIYHEDEMDSAEKSVSDVAVTSSYVVKWCCSCNEDIITSLL